MLINKKTTVANNLMEIGVMFNKYFKRLQNKKKISMLKLDALNFIVNNANSNMSQLAKYLDSTQPALTNLINNMITRELITKKVDLIDKRISRLEITFKGQEELIMIKALMKEEMEKIFKILTPNELHTYLKTNKKLIINMKYLITQYKKF